MYWSDSGLHLSLIAVLTFKRSLNDEQKAGSCEWTTHVHVSNPSFSCYLSAKYQKTSRFVGALLWSNCQRHQSVFSCDLATIFLLFTEIHNVQSPVKGEGFIDGNSSTQECGSPYMRGLTSVPNNMSWKRLIMHAMALFFATQYWNLWFVTVLRLRLWNFINFL